MFEYFVKKLSKDNRGFTLIELVVVIAILGILAAIAVPRMSGTTKKAAVSAHNANVRTLESAANMYIVDNPGNAVNWPDDAKTYENYIQEWPTIPKGLTKVDGKTKIEPSATVIYKVSITDGKIEVTPGKANDDGKVSKDPQ